MQRLASDLQRRGAEERANRDKATPKRLTFDERLAKEFPAPQPLTPEQLAQRAAAAAKRKAENDELARLSRRRALSEQVGRRYANCSLDSFKAATHAQRDVLCEVSSYARNILEHAQDGTGLVLMGPSGTGKDHLCTAVLFVASDAGLSTKWACGVSLFAGARDAIRNDETESEWLDRFTRPDVLLISDPVPPAGMIREGWQISKLFAILDGRYRLQKPTLLTVNVISREEAVDRMSENVIQRLEDRSIVLRCIWPTYRRPRQ